jgi:hypothetical protein
MMEPRINDRHIASADIRSLGKSSVVEDGGRVVAESDAIIEYILRNCGSDCISDSISAHGCLKWL